MIKAILRLGSNMTPISLNVTKRNQRMRVNQHVHIYIAQSKQQYMLKHPKFFYKIKTQKLRPISCANLFFFQVDTVLRLVLPLSC